MAEVMTSGYDFRHKGGRACGRYNRESMRPMRILTIAGSLIWLISGIPIAEALLADAERTLAVIRFVTWLVFAGAFFTDTCRRLFGFRASLLLQTMAAIILIGAHAGNRVELALLVMVAGQLPAAFSMPISLLWVGIQTALVFVPQLDEDQWAETLAGFLAYLAFQLFAVGAAGLAESERRARQELAEAKSRLEVVQERLSETAREAERLRIARDLHDSLGHHLTALGLDLELALHLAKGDVRPPVERARALASSLMYELRSAVTEMRADSRGDLASRLKGLVRTEGRPRVEVTVVPGAESLPRLASSALTRVAQEIVTNATKHSMAQTVRLTLEARATEWVLEGHDDGVGESDVQPGHGLLGMRERVESIGGVLRVETSQGRGFSVTATVPMGARR